MLTFNKRIINYELKNYYNVDKTEAADVIRGLVQVLQYFIKDLPDDIHLKKPSKENQELYSLLQKILSSWLVDKEAMRSDILKIIEITPSEDILFKAYTAII